MLLAEPAPRRSHVTGGRHFRLRSRPRHPAAYSVPLCIPVWPTGYGRGFGRLLAPRWLAIMTVRLPNLGTPLATLGTAA